MPTMPELRITMTATEELVPYAGNAKEHPDEQIEQIVSSIESFGFNDPVAVWHDGDGQPVIVEGHGRVLAAQRMGMAELPTIALDHLTDEQRRAYVHVHNQTTLTSGFDLEVLQQELAALPEFDWAPTASTWTSCWNRCPGNWTRTSCHLPRRSRARGWVTYG